MKSMAWGWLLACSILIFLSWTTLSGREERRFVILRARTDNNLYKVQKREDAQAAADLLGQVNTRIELLINFLGRLPTSKLQPFALQVQRLSAKYSPRKIQENGDKAYTSYALNKEHIFLCLRQRRAGRDENLVPIDVLMYVVLHELAHYGAFRTISEREHETDSEFKGFFALLLQEAASAGVYAPVDFASSPQPYCGLTI